MSGWPQESLTDSLIEQWEVIDSLLSGLEGDAWFSPTNLPGWTVHDVVAHIIGTESLLSGIEPPTTSIDVHTLPHVHNEIAAFNERWVEGLRRSSQPQLLAHFREITSRRAEVLRNLTESDWNAETLTPVGPAPYGRFMRIRIFDCWMHELDIRDAVGAPTVENGQRAEIAFEEITGALGFVVGKRGKAPDGARITFVLDGPLARELHVSVDGRAALVPALDGPATTTVQMSSELFTRVACGRVSAADHRDDIILSGDLAVGKRIVDNLAFTM
ncbi:maleylpyruvate isomerase family mycothiol-dependent enzyme [Rhodococcus sp. ARC_M6]|uniref:maleylpyruvate isomerase family mycothiol-dependent enzyme n=1 Tax=Rhodococcus sp. ARC_M6 TaxID=2928852 RepID=UPI001FB5299B|nr:maleylpyruvate isomerase family mycothiol-dependent enzyme [Rhodococcus sp. ARC_M6]MCJ0906548.1 maleylpyruvate isomerase family mycothiol-dependent enzyme [Rhodococcus sp. ARC_M6]